MNFENVFSEVSTFKEENNDRYIKYKNTHNNLSNEEIVKIVNLSLDYNFYENTMDALNKNTKLILVNNI